jgi:hypothetical protein
MGLHFLLLVGFVHVTRPCAARTQYKSKHLCRTAAMSKSQNFVSTTEEGKGESFELILKQKCSTNSAAWQWHLAALHTTEVLHRVLTVCFFHLFTHEGDTEYTGCGNTEHKSLMARVLP